MKMMRTVLISALVAGSAGAALGQAADNCLVEQAAQAALEREILLIESLATDVEQTFNGPQGCIDPSIFQEFDLSTAIPDLAGLMSSISTNLLSDAIAAARDKVCQQIDQKIADSVGTARGTANQFSSGLTDELRGALDNGWQGLTL